MSPDVTIETLTPADTQALLARMEPLPDPVAGLRRR
jgi:hypothetical protein